MQEINLLHLSSPDISKLDSIDEYQRVYINHLIGEHIKNKSLKARKLITINLKLDDVLSFWKHIENQYNLYSLGEYAGFIIENEFIASLNWNHESTSTGMLLHISSNSINDCEKYINEVKDYISDFLVIEDTIEYSVLLTQGMDLKRIHYQDTVNSTIEHSAFPFIEDIDSYIDQYLNSKAPILLLHGEPGTGKTTFSKYVLHKMKEKIATKKEKMKALYSFDQDVFLSSEFFSMLIYDDYDVLVLEDMNDVIHVNYEYGATNPIKNFLSLTDGIISKYKKVIITTNIESKNQLDEILLRPGRCFDIVNFRKLEGIEIDNLCDNYAQDLELSVESINLSEFYAKCNNDKNSQLIDRKIGF
jgi:SpoVK/Ycf46/Vps4 family AAA+-type ATPase